VSRGLGLGYSLGCKAKGVWYRVEGLGVMLRLERIRVSG
jgi:hypothetical protein